MIDLSGSAKKEIEIGDVSLCEDDLKKSEFILFHTGWSRFWGDDRYFASYPVLSLDLAEWLTGFGLKGIGVDMISVDPVGSVDFRIHTQFFKNNMGIIENLTNLDLLLGKNFYFSCLPLKIEKSDGSPIRAVGVLT